VTSQQIEDYMSQQAGINLSKIFDQYLRDNRIPTFEYKVEGKKLSYRWTNCVAGFDMPVRLQNQANLLVTTTNWQTIRIKKGMKIAVDENFYVTSQSTQ